MNGKETKQARTTAARLAVRRGEFVQLRRRILSETWAWCACFVVLGAILIAPSRSHRIPTFVAGEIASSDVVVDRGVVLPDSESTEEKRRRASLEVLSVYVYDPGVAASLVEKLDRIFQEGRRQSGGDDFDLAQRLGEVGSLVVQPREAAVLRGAHFSEGLLGLMRELVQRIYREGIVGDRTELLHSAERGITLHVADRAEERIELDVYRFLDGGTSLAEVVEQRLAAEPGIQRSWRVPLAALLARAMVPNVVLDRGETLARRLKAASSVEEVSVRLPRGKVLVRRGDEVSAQTARLLAALAERST